MWLIVGYGSTKGLVPAGNGVEGKQRVKWQQREETNKWNEPLVAISKQIPNMFQNNGAQSAPFLNV